MAEPNETAGVQITSSTVQVITRWPYTVTIYGNGIVGSAGFMTQRECIKYGRNHDMASRFVVKDRADGVVREEIRNGWRRIR